MRRASPIDIVNWCHRLPTALVADCTCACMCTMYARWSVLLLSSSSLCVLSLLPCLDSAAQYESNVTSNAPIASPNSRSKS